MANVSFTVPGITHETADEVVSILDDRMVALIDLALTLKHVHWNVIGPNFISVHEMLDPQVEAVREMVDDTAERMTTLGAEAIGTPKAITERRGWTDYSLGRASAPEHLAALDKVYEGINGDHRAAIAKLGELDPLSEDLLVDQAKQLELFQWFVRAHLETAGGKLMSAEAETERGAAAEVRKAS